MARLAVPRLPGIVPVASADPSLAVQALRSFIDGHHTVAVLTGAGCSTESGIPDYRSPEGSYSKGHRPMTHQHFMGDVEHRKRYWARSIVGYRHFDAAQPNTAHTALAELEKLGWVSSLVTQNVDGLHGQAGSQRVVELHGHNNEVECQSCGALSPRRNFQEVLQQVNDAWIDHWLDPEVIDIRADGDAHIAVEDFKAFQVPGCEVCGTGVLKPNVVFFGGSIKAEVK